MAKSKKSTIIDIAKTNIFVSDEFKKEVLTKIDSLQDYQVEELFVLLSEAEEKQNNILKKIIKKNPDFLEKVKKINKAEIRKNL